MYDRSSFFEQSRLERIEDFSSPKEVLEKRRDFGVDCVVFVVASGSGSLPIIHLVWKGKDDSVHVEYLANPNPHAMKSYIEKLSFPLKWSIPLVGVLKRRSCQGHATRQNRNHVPHYIYDRDRGILIVLLED